MGRRRFLRAAASVGAAVAVGGCLSSLDRFVGSDEPPGTIGDRVGTPPDDGTEAWPRVRFDAANTRFNPDVELLPDEPTTRRHTDEDAGFRGGPLNVSVVGESLFWYENAEETRRITLRRRSVDGADGWAQSVRSGVAYQLSTPDVVYATADGLTAFDAETGDVLWTNDDVFGSTVAHDGSLLYAEGPDELAAIRPETGDVEWRLEFDGHGYASTTRLAVASGLLYAFDGDGVVHAVDTDEGHVRWARRLETPDDLEGPLVAAGDVVLVTTSEELIAFGAWDGEIVWRYGDDSYSSDLLVPTVVDDRVFVSATRPDPRPVCLDRESGSERWTLDVETTTEPPLAVADGCYYSLGEAGLLAVSHDGETEWRFEDLGVDRLHAAAGRRLFVSSDPGRAREHLYAIEA